MGYRGLALEQILYLELKMMPHGESFYLFLNNIESRLKQVNQSVNFKVKENNITALKQFVTLVLNQIEAGTNGATNGGASIVSDGIGGIATNYGSLVPHEISS